MTHIVHVTASITSKGGGIPIVLQALACAQTDSGTTCKVIGHDDGGTPISNWPAGIARPLQTRRFPGMPWAAKMADEVQRAKPDLLHTHGLWSQGSIVVPRISQRKKIPFLVSPHGMLDPWALENSRWKKRLAAFLYENRHLQGASCLHALCASEADAIRAYGLKNPIAIIPNGVDLVDAETLTTDHRPQILLFLGRLHPKKGLVNALRAWAKLHRSSETPNYRNTGNWQFVIAGWDQGGHEQELKRLCDELGLAWADVPAAEFLGNSSAEQARSTPLGNLATVIDTPLPPDSCLLSPDSRLLSPDSRLLSPDSRLLTPDSCLLTPDSRPLPPVLFTGPAFGEQKDQLLRSASAFILPSFSEGLPMSVLEAWAYQLPVLMTDHCNLPEGFAAEAAIRIGTDTESIAEGLHSLLASRVSDLTAMGINGRALVSERFTWPQVAAQMKEVYEWVLGGGEKPCSVVL